MCYEVKERRFFSQFGAELGTANEGKCSKGRGEMDSFPLCTETWNLLPMFRGLGEDGVSLTRKAKGYSFFLPCSDFASVYGARGGEVGGDIQTVRAVLTGWWSGMAPPTGRRCSITIAESHLGYLGPDHQAVSGPIWGCPGGSAVKSLPASAGDTGSIPGSRSPGEGNGNPLQYSLPGKSCGQSNLVGYSP